MHLFLDLGVLGAGVSDLVFDPARMALFDSAMKEFPNTAIIVCSQHRALFNLATIRAAMSPTLYSNVRGMTPYAMIRFPGVFAQEIRVSNVDPPFVVLSEEDPRLSDPDTSWVPCKSFGPIQHNQLCAALAGRIDS